MSKERRNQGRFNFPDYSNIPRKDVPDFDKINWPKNMAPAIKSNIYRYMQKHGVAKWETAWDRMLEEEKVSAYEDQTGPRR